MEESKISFAPQNQIINETIADFDENELLDKSRIKDFNDDENEDLVELINLFNEKKPKNKANSSIKDNIIHKKKKKNSNSDKIINSDEKFIDKLKKFLLISYKLICEDYRKENNLKVEEIENEDEEDEYDDPDYKKKKNNFLNIIEKLIENEEEMDNMDIKLNKENNKFNDKYFYIKLYEQHKIKMFNDLLKMKIKIKLDIVMSVKSGNSQINFSYLKINYNKKVDKEIKLNLKYYLVNHILGKRGITYCTCENCNRCKNRYNFPFDDLLIYLKEQNGIKNGLEFTYLFFKGCNSYKNDAGYKCSFCKDFFAKKSNIVRLFCNNDIEPEHTCEFWICRNCYYNKFQNNREEEVCPNCKKFKVNFSILKSYYKWKINKKL